MIDSISITNYRSFSQLTAPDLGRVNLIVGTNNSGKTSLLEAIYLLTSGEPIASLISILGERGEVGSRNPDPRFERTYTSYGYQISHIFHGRSFKEAKPITIVGGSQQDSLLSIRAYPYQNGNDHSGTEVERYEDAETELDRRYTVAFEKSTKNGESGKDSISVSEEGTLLRPAPRRSAMQSPNARLVTTSQLEYDELASLWDDITLTPKEEKVIEALRILEPRVDRISFTSRQTSNSGIRLKLQGESEPVPLGSMGDGMRRILAITASLVSVGKGTLLVDEIDTGLYYNTQSDMWRLVLETAEKQKAQVFATTHSWDCVQAFQKALAQSSQSAAGRLIRLDRNDKGMKAVAYNSDELDIAIEQGIEVR